MAGRIKLIATDIDGTLIQDSTPDLYPEVTEEIRRLTEEGVIFACASGRQYASIRNVFRDVADRVLYIAENGAHTRYRDEIWQSWWGRCASFRTARWWFPPLPAAFWRRKTRLFWI